jgi:hypothetical protein
MHKDKNPENPSRSIFQPNHVSIIQHDTTSSVESSPVQRESPSNQRETKLPAPTSMTNSPTTINRPTRNRRAPKRYGYDGNESEAYSSQIDHVMGLINSEKFEPFMPIEYSNMINEICDNVQDTFAPDIFIKAYNSRTNQNPDSPNLKEALEGPHREEFLEAMKKELNQLHAHQTWLPRIILRQKLPEKTQVVALTWVFKIKRRPNGTLQKFKARLCF